MSKVLRRRWPGDPSGQSRRDRLPCDYEAYVPDRLVGRSFSLDGEVAAAVAEAEAAIIRLNSVATSLVDTEALARILLRAEAVASSRIEGLEVGARRLLHAEVVRGLQQRSADVTATEVLQSIDAMSHAIETVDNYDLLALDLLLEINRRLLAGTNVEQHGGQIRMQQNWIGGSSYNPCSAAFVPPPHEYVKDLLVDLVDFCNDDSLSAVTQAAVAHSQFETIHPFVDGNGRTGRALIHLVLRRRGIVPHVLPPVSLILATWAKDYVNGLNAMRYRGSTKSEAARQGLNGWVTQFATACTRAVADADSFEQRAREIEQSWRDRLGSVRTNSATDLLLRRLPGAPVLTAGSAMTLVGRTFPAVNAAIARLVEVGILKQVTVGRRNRAYESPEIIAAFTDLERQLASPGGNTRTSRPTRLVPRRRESA